MQFKLQKHFHCLPDREVQEEFTDRISLFSWKKLRQLGAFGDAAKGEKGPASKKLAGESERSELF